MKHYICIDCTQTLPEISVCENESCPNQWEMMSECECTDDLHGKEIEKSVVKDSNGNVLQDGDSVVLTKDLTLRGTSQKIKQGTKVARIRLTDNPEEIDCKINGTAIVLRVEFVKKV